MHHLWQQSRSACNPPTPPRCIYFAHSTISSGFSGCITQTIRAHRLSRKAYLLGGQELQEKFLDVIFRAYFTEGQNIGDFNVLGDLAEEAGMMSKDKVRVQEPLNVGKNIIDMSVSRHISQAIEFLTSNECQEEVESMAAEARKKVVTGVPFTIINGRWAVSGGQTSEVYGQVRFRGPCGPPCTDRFCTRSSASWQARVPSMPSPMPRAAPLVDVQGLPRPPSNHDMFHSLTLHPTSHDCNPTFRRSSAPPPSNLSTCNRYPYCRSFWLPRSCRPVVLYFSCKVGMEPRTFPLYRTSC